MGQCKDETVALTHPLPAEAQDDARAALSRLFRAWAKFNFRTQEIIEEVAKGKLIGYAREAFEATDREYDRIGREAREADEMNRLVADDNDLLGLEVDPRKA